MTSESTSNIASSQSWPLPDAVDRDTWQAAIDELRSNPATAHEVPLFPAKQEGVVYVPETAPVLVRAEYGVLAAEAAECGCYMGPLSGRACC